MRNKSAGQLLQDLHSNQDYEFCIDDLFRAGRSALPEIWGSIYPAEELLDDLENYRALELMHESIKFHFKISKQFVNEDNYDEHQDHNEDLQNHLESIREVSEPVSHHSSNFAVIDFLCCSEIPGFLHHVDCGE